MKSLTERRIAAENRLREIEDKIEKLACNGKGGENREEIRGLLEDWEAIGFVWDNLFEEEGRQNNSSLLPEMGRIFKPAI